MNEMYAKRNGEPVGNRNQSTSTEVLDRILKSRRESEERSARIIEHYKFDKMKDTK